MATCVLIFNNNKYIFAKKTQIKSYSLKKAQIIQLACYERD